MSWEEVCHWIAQGAVNISSGITNIEAGSPVHKAMVAFCEYASSGLVKYSPSTFDRAAMEKVAAAAVEKYGKKA